jgi:hypothetical protein
VRLVVGHPAELAQVDVVVEPVDVGEAVVEDVVLPAPDVGAATQEVERPAHQPVELPRSRIGTVVAVVKDVEADAGEGEAERDRERQGLVPVRRQGEERPVGADGPGEQECRLGVNPRAAVARTSRRSQMTVDPGLQLLLKGAVARIL